MDNKTIHDIAIIGGGIAGAGIARDAALRGLSVAVFEKGAFASGASSKSSKLIHGGIRYLESAWQALKRGDPAEAWKDFHFVFVSLRESRVLAHVAPGLVQPMALVIPLFKNSGRGRLMVFAGTFLYFLMAILSGSARWPRFLWTKHSVLEILPGLKEQGLVGGVMIWDHTTDDAGLVRATLASAVKNGAVTLQDAKVEGFTYDAKRRLYEISVRRDGVLRSVLARKLINASGPWIDKLRSEWRKNTGDYLLPVAGSHICFKKFLPYSVILQAADRRPFFVINQGEVSRVGTTERLFSDPDAVAPTEGDVDYLLRALKDHFPRLTLTQSDVLSSDAGIRPLARPKIMREFGRISREHEIRQDASGVTHVIGVKLTDHRRAAEQIVDALMPELWRKGIKKKTLTHRLPL